MSRFAGEHIGDHVRFTANTTAYLRNQSREDLQAKAYAVLYQDPPVKTERGTSISMRFPLLIVAGYVEDQRAVAEKVARILEAHWDDEEEKAQPR